MYIHSSERSNRTKFFAKLYSCENSHSEICPFCESFHSVLALLRSSLSTSNLDETSKILITQDLEFVEKLRGHYLRSIVQRNQQKIIESNLMKDQVFIIMDWDMKFLALRYREKMELFFAKAGLNWHEAVCMFLDENDVVMVKSLTHLCDSTTQGSQTVAAILGHIFMTLKSNYPFLESAIIQTDNAGCYHSLEFMIPALIYGLRERISISQILFSEAQDGKNSCDRVLASKKGLISSFVEANRGNILLARDIMNAFHEMRNERSLSTLQSMESCVVFQPIKTFELHVHVPTKIKITRFSDFRFSYLNGEPAEVSMQEQSGFGPQFECSLTLDVETSFRKLGCIWMSKKDKEIIWDTKISTDLMYGPFQEIAITESNPDKRRKTEPKKAISLRYGCSTPGCLIVHTKPVSPESCKHKFPAQTLRDKVAVCIEKKMTNIRSLSSNVMRLGETAVEVSQVHLKSNIPLTPGNALKPSTSKSHISDAVKEYLTKLFFIGIKDDGTVNKDTKFSAAKAFEALEGEIRREGSNLKPSDLLKPQQITSIFSQLARDLKTAYKFEVLDLTIDTAKEEDEDSMP